LVPATEKRSLTGVCPRAVVRTAADACSDSMDLDVATPAAAATDAFTTSRLLIFMASLHDGRSHPKVRG
jgi:hypothetical protein